MKKYKTIGWLVRHLKNLETQSISDLKGYDKLSENRKKSLGFLMGELSRRLVILLAHSGSQSSPSEASTSPRQPKKRVQPFRSGSDSELIKSHKSSRLSPDEFWGESEVEYWHRTHPEACLHCSYSRLVKTPSKNLKPTVGKKKASLKHRI